MKLTELYEKSHSKLSDATDELESMKKYVKEVLEEMDKFQKSRAWFFINSTQLIQSRYANGACNFVILFDLTESLERNG